MDAEAYLKTSEDLIAVARAEDLHQTQPLVRAVQARAAELRATVEAAPVRSDDLRVDCGGILCEFRGVTWLLALIEAAKQRVETIGG